MKTIILFFISALLCCRLFAQSACTEDSIRYLAAYDYIVKENDNKFIAVSDSIVDLDRFWVVPDMEKYPVEKEIVNQYRANKGYKWFEPYYSDCINFLFMRNNSCVGNVLFFSQIEDNVLVSEFFPFNKNKKNVIWFDKFYYDWVAFQNESKIYLFIFESDNTTIKVVFSRAIIYD